VSWELVCDGPGSVTIGVTAAGIDENTLQLVLPANINPDEVIVQQEWKAHLAVDITLPLVGTTYSSLQHFFVNATISNTGQAAANSVNATISITGLAHAIGSLTKATSPASIPGAGSATVSWELVCDGPGSVTIGVTAAGIDENTLQLVLPANITPDEVTVNQEWKAHLAVDITLPLGGTTYSSLQHFFVNATISNTGQAAANSVNATISITGLAHAIGSLTKATSPANIAGGGSGTVSWELVCDGPGSVTIGVTAAGIDENTLQLVLPANITPDEVTVQQESKVHLAVDITSPLGGATYQPGNSFTVNVTVHNTGQAAATSVNATITITGLASTLDPLTKSTTPASIAGGGSATVSWTLHCDGEGDVTIDVTATGIDENTLQLVLPANIEPDRVIVHQLIIRGNLEIFKFEDKNNNGVYDPGAPDFETSLEDWEFTVEHPLGTYFGTYYTDVNGLILISGLIPGDYWATETVQPDWVCTTGNPKLGAVDPGVTAHLDFGNRYSKKTLKIYKFNDLNGNGVPDSGEGPLGGWEFTIGGIGKRVTGSDGWIIINISISGSGIYPVTETLKSGWLTTTDNPQYADLNSNDIVTLYFGNVEQVKHPPLVPIIGTWGTALMAAVFGGSLIWVIALRRKRRTT
jgi:propanediol dehydratase small subunit